MDQLKETLGEACGVDLRIRCSADSVLCGFGALRIRCSADSVLCGFGALLGPDRRHS